MILILSAVFYLSITLVPSGAITKTNMLIIENKLRNYLIEKESIPGDLEILVNRKDLNKSFYDEWGSKVEMEVLETRSEWIYTIYSLGEDKESSSDDLIFSGSIAIKSNQGDSHERKVSYPYRASDERIHRIDSGAKKILLGTPEEDVIKKLGDPDEINFTLDKNNWRKKIGYSFVYLKQRNQEYGSLIKKNEKLVRIHFDLEGRVKRVDFVPQMNVHYLE